jgi:hypothetical protein
MRKMSFIIPNAWGQYLYQILFPIKDLVDGTWDVGCDVDDPYLQAWSETDDLFASGCYSNQDFFSLLGSCVYYIVSGKFSLTSPHKNRKNGLNPPCIEILVTDSVYVDVYAADEKILFALYDNAIKQGFENIELDG